MTTAVRDTQASAARVQGIETEMEHSSGFEPKDREFERLRYDIESRKRSEGKQRFIE